MSSVSNNVELDLISIQVLGLANKVVAVEVGVVLDSEGAAPLGVEHVVDASSRMPKSEHGG